MGYSFSRLSDMDLWLESLGFRLGDPFAATEADQERSYLPEVFVDVEGYEFIRGRNTVIVFAPRGSGKSALRVVLASQAAPYTPGATVLAVEHTDFDYLLAKRRAGEVLSIEDHVLLLLRSGLRKLMETLCDPELSFQRFEVRQHQRDRLIGFPVSARLLLAQLVRAHYPALLHPTLIYERLRSLDSNFNPPGNEFMEAIVHRRLQNSITDGILADDAVAILLADLNDAPDLPNDERASPVEQLTSLAHVAKLAGLTSIHFMIDRLDEYEETANDAGAQADLLMPLLAHLPLLELPGVAFKFFLSRETRDVLLERPNIRRDRLTDTAVTVHWDTVRLKRLLDVRLAFFSAGSVTDLLQLCADTHIDPGRGQPPLLLGEWIENEMLQLAQGSPRRLLMAGQLLCQAHLDQYGPTGVIQKGDWQTAQGELMRKMPPQLRLHREAPVAWIGADQIQFTVNEFRLLQVLVEHRGETDRETLAEAVWGSDQGVSDAAIDAAVNRIRKKLGDVSSVYLETLRGRGFRLKNYEVD